MFTTRKLLLGARSCHLDYRRARCRAPTVRKEGIRKVKEDMSGQVVVGVPSSSHLIKRDGGRKKGGAQEWRSSYCEGHNPEDTGKLWKSLKQGWKVFTRSPDRISHLPPLHTGIKVPLLPSLPELCILRFLNALK